MSSPQRIDVVIDRLVVHGVGRRQARAIERDVRSRLAELAQGWLDGTAPMPAAGHRRPDGQLTLATSGSGDRLGRDVAAAVFATITAPTTTPPTIIPAGPRPRPHAPVRTRAEGGSSP